MYILFVCHIHFLEYSDHLTHLPWCNSKSHSSRLSWRQLLYLPQRGTRQT